MRLVPQAGSLYWVDTTILPPGDPEAQRLVVVVDVPETVDGTIVVVAKSGVDGWSRRQPVQSGMWTSATVVPAGVLAGDVLAEVVSRFGP
ncbi:MAG TPA: hypothetical protein VF244_03180 [Acidimicrobiales bacterium]